MTSICKRPSSSGGKVRTAVGALCTNRGSVKPCQSMFGIDTKNDDVRPMIELSDVELEAYLERNTAVLKKIISENGISVLYANHAVLMSVVAEAGPLVFLEAMASG